MSGEFCRRIHAHSSPVEPAETSQDLALRNMGCASDGFVLRRLVEDSSWMVQAEDGNIHDPDPSSQHGSPKFLKLSFYDVILPVTIKNLPVLCPMSSALLE